VKLLQTYLLVRFASKIPAIRAAVNSNREFTDASRLTVVRYN
jgi:hypothetical protein